VKIRRQGRSRAWVLGALTAALLAACGGGGDGDQKPRIAFGKLVSFGDSLSDVGSYSVSAIRAVGGGQYTINSAEANNWTQRLARTLGVPVPCAAQTGLQSVIPQIPDVPVTNIAGCFGYGQGGSRVTNPLGIGNIGTLAVDPANAPLGQLTDPVINQINRHLAASGGSFAANDLVTLLAGGNDLFSNLGAAQVIGPTAAVTNMGVAGGELAAYVKNLIVARGAKYVVVVNLPDVSKSPFGASLAADARALTLAMVQAFNQQLGAGLAGTSGVLLVDAFTQSQDQAANPSQYSISNGTTPACDNTKMILPTSLVCTAQTLVGGDTSRYTFADTVHPTPYGHQLLAQFVAAEMTKAGWL
jgi:outer membrane lipase/esterase